MLNHTPSYTSYNEFYRDLMPKVALTKQIPISPTQMLSLGYQGNVHITDTPQNPQNGVNDRTDQALLVAYTHGITPDLIVQPYYRFMFSHYLTSNTRNDMLHSLGISLTYFINEWASVRAFANWDHRDTSNTLVSDYQQLDGGIGVNVTVRF